MSKMFYVRDGYDQEAQGPYSGAEVKAMVKAGEVTARHQLSEDKVRWVLAGVVKQLFPPPAKEKPAAEPQTGSAHAAPGGQAVVVNNVIQGIPHQRVETRSELVVIVLWLFLGGLGAHRFYIGDMLGGVLWCGFTLIVTPIALILTMGLWVFVWLAVLFLDLALTISKVRRGQ